MIVHMGSDAFVNGAHILLVLDAAKAHQAEHKAWINKARREGRLIQLPGGNPKCIIITARPKEKARHAQVILSPVAASTIRKRMAEGKRKQALDG